MVRTVGVLSILSSNTVFQITQYLSNTQFHTKISVLLACFPVKIDEYINFLLACTGAYGNLSSLWRRKQEAEVRWNKKYTFYFYSLRFLLPDVCRGFGKDVHTDIHTDVLLTFVQTFVQTFVLMFVQMFVQTHYFIEMKKIFFKFFAQIFYKIALLPPPEYR